MKLKNYFYFEDVLDFSNKMYSDSDDEMSPPNVTNLAKSEVNKLLPKKSRDRYENVYKKFMIWRQKHNISSFSENVLMAYFDELSNEMKPSSLWSIYSMLRSTLCLKQENINIAQYMNLIELLKCKSNGFRSKKSNILTAEEINNFLIKAPDSKYLLMKVHL